MDSKENAYKKVILDGCSVDCQRLSIGRVKSDWKTQIQVYCDDARITNYRSSGLRKNEDGLFQVKGESAFNKLYELKEIESAIKEFIRLKERLYG